MILRSRSILLGCVLLAFVRAAFGAGEYQQGRDGKTMIWNWTPKPGEKANWTGGRDKENYAEGFGDLALYDSSGKVSGLYYGKMVHGKLEGAVNVHADGRVLHAYFVDGGRVTSWSRGAAKSAMSASEAALVEKRKAEAEKEAAKKENIARAEAVTTPTPKKEKPATEKIAKAEVVTPPAERAVRGAETYHKEAKEKSQPVTEKKSEPLSAEEELKRTEPAPSTSSSRTYLEPTPLPKSETETRVTESVPLPTAEPSEPERETKQSPPPVIEETPPIIHEPVTEQKPEITNQQSEVSPEPSSAPTTKETPADVSLNSLVGPPSSLRSNPVPETSPERRETESAPRSSRPLTESEATSLADAEARQEGCPLDRYERPKVDHSEVKGKWSFFYTVKKGESGLPPMFSATVEDKTKKVEIKK